MAGRGGEQHSRKICVHTYEGSTAKRDEIEGDRLMARDECRPERATERERYETAVLLETSLGITDSCGHGV